MKIYHQSQELKYREPFGAVTDSSPVRLAVLVDPEGEPEDLIESVQLRLWWDETGEILVTMEPIGDGLYETEITAPAEGGLLWYYFRILYDGCAYFYGNGQDQKGGEGCTYDVQPPSYQITVYENASVPDWYKDGIVYQIFPDRFARDEQWRSRCEKALEDESERKGQKKILEEDWDKPAYYVKDSEGNVTQWPFYGGSLRGIEEKLDYLRSLGVTAIYLNPIFQAASNHRYDTGDYRTIDPILGTKEDFVHLADTAREKGIRLILDGVFSHTGADSLYFDRYGNYGGQGAYQDPDSPYRDWYEFREDDPVGYRCWWGVRDLPEVIEGVDSYREMICGEDGVLAQWLRAGASGWRLDVADELPDAFIQEIRRRIKEENENNLLLGEVWEDASNKISYDEKRKYLMGNELDAAMNYPLRELLTDYMDGKIPASRTAAGIMSLAENYPPESFYGNLNLIGSHDRTRILTRMGAEQDYGGAIRRVKLLSVLQYALPGVPCIFYGDEAGMQGHADPENRGGYPWGKEQGELQYHYRQLGVLYGEHPVLKSGSLTMLDLGDDDVLAFLRSDSEEQILILANRNEERKRISKERLEGLETGYALELLTSTVLAAEDGRIREDLVLEGSQVQMICLLKEAPHSFTMQRSAGVICHISSLPGGVMGSPARDFVDYLAEAGMNLWQILPLNPTGPGDSPYSSPAAFAGDPKLINVKELADWDGYDAFCKENADWLDSYAAYVSLKQTGRPDDKETTRYIRAEQYQFHAQWEQLRSYANSKGIKIIGDLPIFVSKDSADVMAEPEQFQIDGDGHLRCHAGVPPDYFCEEGQDWGNPLYDWDVMERDGYQWWIRRLKQCFQRFDFVRLDHFRSFSQYFAIPEGEKPVSGNWRRGPGLKFFRAMKDILGDEGLRILAEDLGTLDTGVYDLLKLAGLPGMDVWQFTSETMKAMTPQEASCRVFYTGTHDNQTLMGWCREQGMDEGDALSIIRQLYESDAPWVILQLQDLFLLGDEARMNVPGIPEGNWKWRLPEEGILKGIPHSKRIAAGFRQLARETGRGTYEPAQKFLAKHGLVTDPQDLPALTEQMVAFYREEIRSGRLRGTAYACRNDNDCVVAVDLGGTNTRVARIRIRDGRPIVEKQMRRGTPGRDEAVTAEELFDALAEMVAAVDREQECTRLGLCFSFPLEQEGQDGTILGWNKELKIRGGEGSKAGELLKQALERHGQPGRQVVVANDTACAMLAGNFAKTILEEESCDAPCIAGFVLGTGVNICCLDSETKLVYNLESGGYPDLPSGDLDASMDEGTSDPGEHLAEKMMSGAYLQPLIRHVCRQAILEGEVNRTFESGEDRRFLEGIEKCCIERSEMYAAVMLAAAAKLSKVEAGRYLVTTEGSTFWKIPGFSACTRRCLEKLLRESGVEIELIQIPDAGLLGAAALAQAAEDRTKGANDE